MHAVGVPVLLCFVFFLPERNKEMQGKARTSSSKGERGRAKARTNKARKLTHRRGLRRDGAKHGVAQSTASRKANQIASEKQIASSKQSTKYVDGRTKNEAARHHRSTTAKQSTYSTTPKPSTTSSKPSTTSSKPSTTSYACCNLRKAFFLAF